MPWSGAGAGGPNTYGMQAGQQLQGAQAAGFFNPMGSPQINAAVRAGALRSADNARRRAAILSRLMGLDPNQARLAAVQADTGSSAATQEALGNAQLGQLLGNQQYFRQLFGGQLGNEQQRQLMRYQSDLAQRGQLGGMLGQLGGIALGSAIPGFFGGYGGGGGGAQTPSLQYLLGAAGL